MSARENRRGGLVTAIALAAALALGGCGATATPAQPEPTTAAPAAPTETAAPRIIDTPTTEPAAQATMLAKLAQLTGVGADEIRVLEMAETTFPNSALGCPQPGRMYSEVLTPGYIFVVEVGGQQIEVHTDATGAQMVRCEQESSEGSREMSPTAKTALALVSEQSGLTLEALRVVSVEEVEWPDSSLGCPQPGMMYAQVITPGFRVVVESTSGETFDVHLSQSGGGVVCTSRTGTDRGGVTPIATPRGATAVEAELPKVAQRAAEAARLAAAEYAGMLTDDIIITDWHEEVWPDTGLGCPAPGEMYLQVLTPGFRFTADAGGEKLEIHTNRSDRAVVCVEGSPQTQPSRDK